MLSKNISYYSEEKMVSFFYISKNNSFSLQNHEFFIKWSIYYTIIDFNCQ